jgi:phenylacetate-CoA ligase
LKPLELLYSRLPAWAQDLAVSAQGALYRRQRFGAAFREEYAFLAATDHAPPLQLDLLQTARLKRTLQHAAARVPFYTSRIARRHYESLRAGDWKSLLDIPLTPKSALRQSPQSFFCDGFAQSGWIPWHTSGTTGTPITLHYNPESVARQYAFVERYREQAGVSRFLRRGQFTGRLIAPASSSQSSQRYWRYDWANQALLLSTVHLSAEAIPRYLDALRRFRPAYLSGYPSAIALLAQHLIRHPEPPLGLKAVLTSAETLGAAQRQAIEIAFGCKVFDQYGQTEMQSFWFECRYGHMHAHPLFGVTEILRPNGEPCLPEETGDVVLTGFLNTAMPLVRYMVGDRAAWSQRSSCPCGHHMPIIAGLEGRKDDYLYSRERGWVGRMDPALKGVHGVVECQFLQEEEDRLQVLYVASNDFSDRDRQQLYTNLRARLGPSMDFVFRPVDQIPRGPNGKFRPVISRIAQINPHAPLPNPASPELALDPVAEEVR